MNPFRGLFDATERRLRLFVALNLLPQDHGYNAAALQAWLEALPMPGQWPTGEDATFQISLSADLHRTRWQAWGDRVTLLPSLLAFLEQTGAPLDGMGTLQRAVLNLRPTLMGTWLELVDEAVDTGWFIPETHALSQAWSLLEPCPVRPVLERWAAAYDVTRCLRVGQSVGEGERYNDLLFGLPGSDVETQLEAGLAAFEVLGIPALPRAAIGLLASGQPGLRLSLWLTKEGIAKAGILLPSPDTTLMLRLCTLTGAAHDETWAAFEGALEVSGTAYIECQQLASGFGIELHYDLSG